MLSRFAQRHERVAALLQGVHEGGEAIELALLRDGYVGLMRDERLETLGRVEHVDAVELEVDERFARACLGEDARAERAGHREARADHGGARAGRDLDGELEDPVTTA